jgi:hypothetical protein
MATDDHRKKAKDTKTLKTEETFQTKALKTNNEVCFVPKVSSLYLIKLGS